MSSDTKPVEQAAPSERVIIFDTTLRDGEQSPGCSMAVDEKLRVAEVLEAMGVDVIEAGFPIASEGDFHAVNEIAKLIKGSVICGLARAANGDIDRAAEALAPAVRGRIHTFIGTSPLHRKYQLQLDAEEVHQRVIDSVSRARRYTDDVEWSGMDASRTEPDFLFRCIESAIKAGATDKTAVAAAVSYAATNIPETLNKLGVPSNTLQTMASAAVVDALAKVRASNEGAVPVAANQ